MLRLLGIATLVLMAVCLAIGASIALANADAVPAVVSEQRKVEAVDPDRRMIDNSLAAIASSDSSNQDI
ncbi:MAG TPA: hypothetical protein VJV39_15520 [Dongiaceae bacterium]|nr:hypothetical protein [Dongiaceae bacterium]